MLKKDATDYDVIRLGRKADRIGKSIMQLLPLKYPNAAVSWDPNIPSEFLLLFKNGDVFSVTVEPAQEENLVRFYPDGTVGPMRKEKKGVG